MVTQKTPAEDEQAALTTALKVALVTPGDRAARDAADPAASRFAALFDALQSAGHRVELAIYDDDFKDDVKEQLTSMDVALVWVNPVHEGRTRTVLDQMLREVAEHGVIVSAHPDAIMAVGTKRVLYDTQHLGWGCHTDLYATPDELFTGLQRNLAAGPRVLKQHRGSSGAGVWRATLPDGGTNTAATQTATAASITKETQVLVRHAKRGSVDELLTLGDFCKLLVHHLLGDGLLIDQAFQPRIAEGMIRCYLVRDRVAGFGHQQVNALISAVDGEEAPAPGPRLYHPQTMAEYQNLRHQLEGDWLPKLAGTTGLSNGMLPLLWDCDFLLGPPDAAGLDTYVLCEINVSSVSPFPDSVIPALVDELSTGLTNLR